MKLHKITTNIYLQKSARFLPSIFLIIVLTGIIQQIFIVNNLPKLKQSLQNSYLQKQQKNIITLKQQKVLKQKIITITSNQEGLESVARRQLGFVKNGEKYYIYPK